MGLSGYLKKRRASRKMANYDREIEIQRIYDDLKVKYPNLSKEEIRVMAAEQRRANLNAIKNENRKKAVESLAKNIGGAIESAEKINKNRSKPKTTKAPAPKKMKSKRKGRNVKAEEPETPEVPSGILSPKGVKRRGLL